MTQVTARASNGGGGNIGVDNYSSSPTMTQVTASASGESIYAINSGVRNTSSSPIMTQVTASASGGKNSYGVNNSDNSSPTMTLVTASALNGENNSGVYNYSYSSPTMTQVTAIAREGKESSGVYNFQRSSPIMTQVTASASGTSGDPNSYSAYAGVINSRASSPIMTQVTASASGGIYNRGLFNYTSSSPKIRDSSFEGSTIGISEITTDTRISNTQVVGGIDRDIEGGTECRNVYDANLVEIIC